MRGVSQRRVRVALAVAVIGIAAGGGATVGRTVAAFSGTTGNSGNSFSAAASFNSCSPATITPVWLSGLEHGYSTGAGGGSWNIANGTGTSQLDSAVKRNGSYSLKLTATANIIQRGRLPSTGTLLIARFAILLDTLPSSDVSELAGMTSGANITTYLSLRYKASTQHFAIGFPGQTVEATNITVQANTWYVIDMKMNVVANPNTAALRVNKGAEVTTSNAVAASTTYGVFFGTSVNNTFTAHYDDIVFDQTAADWPIGDGKVLAVSPDSTGTHVNSGRFQNENSTAIDTSPWNRLDDVPVHQSTDYIKQVTADTTPASYIEVGFADTTASCIRAVNAYVIFDPQGTNQSDNGKTSLFDGSTERVVYSGDMAGTSTAFSIKAAVIPPLSAPWTTTELNGLKARLGYSTDVSPLPMWHSLMLEYEVGQ